MKTVYQISLTIVHGKVQIFNFPQRQIREFDKTLSFLKFVNLPL